LQIYDHLRKKLDKFKKRGDHLSGKPGNVREFDGCQGYVKDFTKNQGNVLEKNLVRKSCLKLFNGKLHICIHTGI